MQEITTLSRYEIRGNIVWDKQEKRPVTLDETRSALEFYSQTLAVIGELKSRGMYADPF